MTNFAKALVSHFFRPPPDGPVRVYRRGGRGKTGRLTGSKRLCGLEGCTGWRLMVRWPNGKVTWPCTKGMKIRRDGQYQIE